MVFVPFSDDNPRLVVRYPYVAWSLIAVNLAVYVVFQSGLVLTDNQDILMGFGVIPAIVTGEAFLPADVVGVPAAATFVSSLFLHGDLFHLIGNLLFIFVFADNIEDSMGHFRFILFYLLCGAAGAGAHVLAMPDSQAPLIGASAAVAGVIAAYLLLHPRVKVWVLLFGRIPLRITALWIILAWIVVQSVSLFTGVDDATGWWAHLGGFTAGALLIPLFKRPEVEWFGRPPKTF